MAQSFVSQNGETIVVPGTYVSVNVQSGQGNTATAGVLTLIGEANQGPDWTQEANLSQNFFTPSQFNLVQAKYGSGRLVDAFFKAISAANDPAITGAVSQVYIVKTNPSQPGGSTITRQGFGNYASLAAKSQGAQGNLINYLSQPATVEAAPTLPAFAYCPQYSGSLSFSMRTNGGNLNAVVLPARTAGPAFVTALNNIADGLLATGGNQYQPLTGLGSGSITLSAAPISGFPTRLLITLQAGQVFDPAPSPGDSLVIVDSDYGTSHASCIKGTGGVNNAGSYVVVSVINTLSTATIAVQLINGEAGSSLGSASGTINAAADDILGFTQVTVENITGQDRQATVGLSGTFTCSSNDGTNVVLTAPTTWNTQPVIGDYITFSATFAGITAGFYQVTASTGTSVSFSRLSPGSAGTTGVANVVTPITQGTQPFIDERQVIDGLGKSLEVVGNIESIAINPQTYAGADYSNSLAISAAEYSEDMTIAYKTASNTYTSGGQIVLEVGSTNADSTMVIGPTSIQLKQGATVLFTLQYSQYETLAQLAGFIASQTGFNAQVTESQFNNLPPTVLDEGTFGISGGSSSILPGRIKQDAIDWYQNINGNGLVSATLIQFSGLPDTISPPRYLSGGTLAGTTAAAFTAAIDACKKVNTNFITPLISQDAAQDIVQGLTDPSSTYTISAINAYLEAHVIAMSALQMRKNRLAVGSYQGTYSAIAQEAGQLASDRFGLTFQPCITVTTQGVSQTFQPWMSAVVAAGMQLAAGYKGIVKKFANIQGYLDPVGFDSTDPGDQQEALLAGLLFLETVPAGGFRWVSDQLTYSADNNFVYNSLQAVYLADLMTLTLIAAFDATVVGQSVAQISATAALGVLEAQMFNFLKLRWIAPSSDAPKGYKNPSADLEGGVMSISVEVKLAGLIYFVPISLTISEVSQQATG